jgi:ABC-type Mn2+/Zn2+ transport system ATPase subunit
MRLSALGHAEADRMRPIRIPDRSEAAAVEDVSFAYGRTPVLDGVSLSLLSGELTALVGPNGAGKSTLLRIMLGLLRPASGRVRLLGEDPRDLGSPRPIGYVTQRRTIAPDLPATVEEVVRTGLLSRVAWWRPLPPGARTAVDEALSAVALTSLRHRLHRELSGGEQQRALVAKALAGHPRLLVLDEPLAGIDAESQGLLVEALLRETRDRDTCVLVVSHELRALQGALDRIVVLDRRVVFDGPADVLERDRQERPEQFPLWLGPLG